MGKVQEAEIISNGINRICAGTTFAGVITAAGDIRIDGVLEGNITTKGKLVVGETGRIKGDIVCKNADILGVVEGKTAASDFLTLKPTARVLGDVSVVRLMIEVGAIFVGHCSMNGGAQNAKS